jgi:hypothetical protein
MSKSVGDLAALRAHIDATPAYSGMTDADVAAHLNGEQVTMRGGVDMEDVLLWVARNGIRSALAAGVSQGGAIGDLCANALGLIDSPHVDSLAVGDENVAAMLDTLTAVGIIENGARDALLELAPVAETTRGEWVFGRGVSSSDVSHARGVA